MLASKDFQYCKFCQQEICLSNCEKIISEIVDFDKQKIEITYICPNDQHYFYRKTYHHANKEVRT